MVFTIVLSACIGLKIGAWESGFINWGFGVDNIRLKVQGLEFMDYNLKSFTGLGLL